MVDAKYGSMEPRYWYDGHGYDARYEYGFIYARAVGTHAAAELAAMVTVAAAVRPMAEPIRHRGMHPNF